MSFLTESAKEQYGPIFDALLPKMSQIIAGYSTLKPSITAQSYSEYAVNRVVNGVNRVFLIGFVTNEFGQWQLDTM